MLLSRPKRQLWLSWRSADDEGGAGARSPFVDDVRELLSPALPDGIEERDEALFAEAGGRGLADSVFDAADAPTAEELRALARGSPAPRRPARPRGRRAHRRRRRAGSPRTASARGPLRLEPVLEQMERQGAVRPLHAREVRRVPLPLVRRPRAGARSETTPLSESLAAGSVAHQVLEKLYLEPPADDKAPTMATLDAWIARARELIAELGPEKLPRDRADTAALLHRVEGLVVAFLLDEARAGAAFQPDPS